MYLLANRNLENNARPMGVDDDVDKVCIICLFAFSIGRMLSPYFTSLLELITTYKCFILDNFFMPVALTMCSMFFLGHVDSYEHAFLQVQRKAGYFFVLLYFSYEL